MQSNELAQISEVLRELFPDANYEDISEWSRRIYERLYSYGTVTNVDRTRPKKAEQVVVIRQRSVKYRHQSGGFNRVRVDTSFVPDEDVDRDEVDEDVDRDEVKLDKNVDPKLGSWTSFLNDRLDADIDFRPNRRFNRESNPDR